MSLYLGTTPIAVNSSSREIGEIILSTIPLTDAGLHLLDGGVISGSGAYSAFVTYIAGLVSGHSELFTTEANWQTSVTNYGVCGKFVYDSVNNTVRLPKITGFTEGTIDPTTLGDLTQAGLPNITGTVGTMNDAGSGRSSGALSWVSNSSQGLGGNFYGISGTTTFNASASNTIYGNSSTVQPQAIKVLYYIVIATSTKTSIEVDIDEIATDLNGKADVDLSNINPTQTIKNTIVGWGMPDFSAGVSKTKANGSISGKGYLLFTTNQNVDTCNITIGTTVFKIGGNYNTLDTLFVPVDNNSYSCSNWSIINTLVFIPLKGV